MKELYAAEKEGAHHNRQARGHQDGVYAGAEGRRDTRGRKGT